MAVTVGDLVASLRFDTSKFEASMRTTEKSTAGLKAAFDKMANDAQAAARKMEQGVSDAFTTLGIKSTRDILQQQQAVRAAYEHIRSSATSTFSDITRAEEA